MCGILGVIGCAGIEEPKVRQALAELTHRGPDGEGLYRSAPEAPAGTLGHRRLSIIDLVSGGQPMANEDGSLQVAFNGEIYNYRSLRRELEAGGHRFTTASDTEVLVHGYEAWGASLPERLRGMFAFAVFDVRTGEAFLARDRFGQKPLYYSITPRALVFASELKAVLALGGDRGLDPTAFTAYLRYGYVPEPLSIYRGISKLPAAHSLLFVPGQGASVRRYWTLPQSQPAKPPCPEALLVDQLDALLEDAVLARMVADVPLGAFLSGGLDSSLIASCMCRAVRLGGGTVQTFSIGFPEQSYDESGNAAAVARYLGTDHHTETVSLDPACSVALLERLDEPFGDASLLPTARLSEMTRRHVTVALSGDGADELFAGYRRYAAARWAQTYNRLPRAIRDRLIGRLIDALPRPEGYYGASLIAKAKLFREFADRVDRDPLAFSPSFFREPELEAVLGGLCDFTADPVRAAATSAPGTDDLERMLRTDLETYLCGDILFKVDRASMLHSLEARCPFLDHPLAEWTASLPLDLKLRGRGGKYLLRKVAGRYLPREVLERPKHGFMAPVDAWFRDALGPIFMERIDACSLIRREPALRYLAEHRAGLADHSVKLWILLVLALVLPDR